jgi:hypothetical protein
MRPSARTRALQTVAHDQEHCTALTLRRLDFWRRYQPQTGRAQRAQGNMLAALELLHEHEPEAQACLTFDAHVAYEAQRRAA